MSLRCFRVVPRRPDGAGAIAETPVDCLSCGQSFTLFVDTSRGRDRRYVRDCPGCGRPVEVRVQCPEGDVVSVEIAAA